METAELIARIKQVAYLEGDFLLRSGRRSKYYLDKYLFETQPEILAELGKRLADRVDAKIDRIAGAGEDDDSGVRGLRMSPISARPCSPGMIKSRRIRSTGAPSITRRSAAPSSARLTR